MALYLALKCLFEYHILSHQSNKEHGILYFCLLLFLFALSGKFKAALLHAVELLFIVFITPLRMNRNDVCQLVALYRMLKGQQSVDSVR